jgi:hypothetical protein
MKGPDAVNGENIAVVANRSRKPRVFLKFGVAIALAVCLLLAALHFFGIIPIHRVPRILTAPFRSPQRANITNPINYERAKFSFSYPENWRIDTSSEHHNPDSFLILDAPRHGQVRLQILAVETDSRAVAEQVAARFQFPGLRVTNRSAFHTWGRLDGDGLILLGEKLGEPFQFRVFAYSGKTQSLIVWEYWWDGADSINAVGFKLIEDSFRFLTAGNEEPE